MKKVYIIIGTRPEIIKMSPLIPVLAEIFQVKVIYTGQHYSDILSKKIFKDLELSDPDYSFNSKNSSTVKQFSKMILNLATVLEKDRPDAVIVHGDTNTTLAGALTSNKLGIPIIHVEAGARSGNKEEPEEVNRMLVDQMAFINFAFSKNSLSCLKVENIKKNIFNFPNTAREAVLRNIGIAHKRSGILKKLALENKKYIVSTLHRATNTSDAKILKKYFYTLRLMSKDNEIVVSLHPRTKRIIDEKKIKIPRGVRIIAPVGYLDFLCLVESASFAFSDSGGIVDESLVLNTPLIIFRNETERGDVIKLGKARLLPPRWSNSEVKEFVERYASPEKIKKMRDKKSAFEIYSSKKIVRMIQRLI